MIKSILNLAVLMLCGAVASAQVSFFVGDCSENAGGFEISVPEPGTDWGVPDMTDPNNLITGEFALADDSLACTPPVNAAELAGKIAVVYRGACEFGAKALAVQEAGAIGCMIINHSPGVIPMGGGASGGSVTIPVWMISNSDGALLYEEIANGTIDCVILGNLNGYFENNLRMTNNGILRPSNTGNVAALCQDETEFSIDMGAWVFNFGQEEETNAVLNVTIGFEGSEIYNEDSAPTTIAPQDSAYITLPTFAQSSYPAGNYTMNYTITGTGDDEFAADNVVNADFQMGNAYSYGRLDADGVPSPTNYTSAGGAIGVRNTCIFFSDPNASRVELTSFSFSGTHFTETIADYDIELTVYEWLDEYAGTATTLTSLDVLDSDSYTFAEEDMNQVVTVEFGSPVELDDDQNYLFCITNENDGLQTGYDNKTLYDLNTTTFDVPITPYFDEGAAFSLGLAGQIPAFSVNFNTLVSGLEEVENVEITPFPNPVSETLTIPFPAKLKGQANLNIYSTDGRLVSQQPINVNTNQLEVNVSGIANGSYVFELQFEEAKSTFNVVVNR
jgi:hypothetical protein